MTRRALLAFVVLTALVPAAARAQQEELAAEEDPAATQLEARRLFEEGTAALRAGRDEEAVELLARSHALLPNVPNGYNLAVALLRRARVVEALALLTELERDAFGVLEPAQREAVADRITEGRRALASVRVVIAGAPRAEIVIDDAPVGIASPTLPLAREVDPGAHRVEARAEGHTSDARTIEAASGTTTRVELALTPLPSDAGPSEPGAHDAGGGDDAWVWVVVGVGVLAVAGGIVLGVVLANEPLEPVVDPVTGIGETLRGPLTVSW